MQYVIHNKVLKNYYIWKNIRALWYISSGLKYALLLWA